MIPLSKLEVKDTISAWQLSLLVGANIVITLVVIVKGMVFSAGQYGWISCLLAGALYTLCAWLMLRLGQYFPHDSFVEYMPAAAGKIIGHLAIGYLLVLWFLFLVYVIRGFANIITYYMFDRTPIEVIGMIMLILSSYCSVQDFGTVIRIAQFFFVLVFPLNAFIWYSIVLNFQTLNILPLLPMENYGGIIKGAVFSWQTYAGYEIILLFLPFVHRGEINLSKALCTGMGFITIVYSAGIFILIGVLSAATIQNVPYPAITAVKSVEIPGTFIERLENYMLLTWIPIAFLTIALTLFSLVWALKQYFKFNDHRPFVPALGPFLFLGISLLDRIEVFNKFGQIVNYMGMFFSLVFIPAILAAVWLRRRNVHGRS